MNPPAKIRSPQTGIVLTVALLLLLLLTLLAISSLHGAGTELAMAGNEKFRQQAASAAEAGIESALANLSIAALTAKPESIQFAASPGTALSTERTTVTTRYLGDIMLVPGFSTGKFIGRSFEINSVGTSLRAAKAERTQGAIRIDSSSAAFGALARPR
jgi:Tfp pilus assembly protein PilX